MPSQPKFQDLSILLLGLVLSVLGLVAIWDAGYVRAAADGWFIPREFISQGTALFASALTALAVTGSRPKILKQSGGVAIALALIGLACVRIFGERINGAKRWIDLGFFSVQPSEFAKLAVILFLAGVLATRPEAKACKRTLKAWYEWVDHVLVPRLARAWPLVPVGAVVVLIELEPDLATAIVVTLVAVGMLFLGGVRTSSLGVLVTVGTGLVLWQVVNEPYRMERLLHHGERWDTANVRSIGYQTTQSEAAMRRGGLFGVGLGEGRAKHTLPAPTTDFIMTTVAEETGLVGTLVVMGTMGLLVWRLARGAQEAKDRQSRLVLGGMSLWIGVQTCTNLLMANGTLPPIGVPMPFLSAGGSSLMALWLGLGVCQALLNGGTVTQKEEAAAVGRDGWRHGRPRVSRA